MNAEQNTAFALKLSVWLSVTVIIIGLISHLFLGDDTVLEIGIYLLILSPFIGVIITAISLFIEKDTKWIAVALVLIAISAIGIIIKN